MANCEKEYSLMIVDKYWEREMEKIKQIDFPITIETPIPESRCINEIKTLITKQKAVKTLSPTIRKFHKSIIYANREKHLSPYDGWQLLKNDTEKFKQFYENRLRCSDWYNEKNGKNFHYLSEGYVPEFIYGIGLTTSGKYPVVSYFKPQLAKYLVTKYLDEYKTVFDPFSGYSGRMMGVLSCGKHYVGRDLCELSVNESKEIYNFMYPILCSYYNYDIKCDIGIADCITSTGTYDCLLTCSPYGNIENWKGVESTNYNCDRWIDICLQNYDCNKYVFVTDNLITKYRKFVKEELENTSHWGSNIEYVVVIEKSEKESI